LGTRNQNLPGYVVLCPGQPVVGSPLWNSSFLPAVYQGTHIPNNETDPEKMIRYVWGKESAHAEQRQQLDLLERLNRAHLAERGNDTQLGSAIDSMETAFRMQTEAPEAFDAGKESAAARARYGDGDFGRGCLMALRLVERGVRMVQTYCGNGQPWDNHDDIVSGTYAWSGEGFETAEAAIRTVLAPALVGTPLCPGAVRIAMDRLPGRG